MRHKKLSPKNPEFWNFSLDEMVDHDLPSFIDFILEKTGKPSVGYVGMGQGSNAMFGLLSTNTEYNYKIKPFVAIAPAVKLSNATRIPIPVLKITLPIPGFIKNPILRFAEIVLRSTSPGPLPLLSSVGKVIAYVGSGNMFQYHLSRLMNLVSSSFVASDLNQDRLTVYAAQTHLCLSKKNAAHLLQTMIYDEFSRFDNGDDENEKIYGDVDPPNYDLKHITNRTVAIIHCKRDQYTSRSDIDFIGNTMNGK
jgi:lysosomal acid lipase/cholesteryl ester hydrolase